MNTLIIVDSGTTTTRVRVVRGTEVIRTLRKQVGARDTAMDGHNTRLRMALGRMLAHIAEEENDLGAVVFSGMITSNVGLLEVPHLVAPAGPSELADGVVRHDFPELTDLPCYFIPGIRTRSPSGELAGLDLLRGEEVEIAGLRQLLAITTDAVFVHYGSHHKAIDVDAQGHILTSRTSLTGEMLSALHEHTILKSSMVPPNDLELDDEAWRHGLADALSHGASRALYLVRVGEQIGGYSRSYMTSYLLGILTSLDLPLVGHLGARIAVLYGRGPFKHILASYLEGQTHGEIVLVDDDTAERAAVVGVILLMQLSGCLAMESI